MFYYKSESLSAHDNYKLLTGSIIPRPIAWVTSESTSHVVNAAPFSYFSIVSGSPALISISINRINGHPKDTARNILNNHEAVIQIVDQSVIKEMNTTSASVSSDVDELELANLFTEPSVNVHVPRIKKAKIQLEATLFKHVPIEQKEQIITDLLILEVKSFHFDDAIFNDENKHILVERLNPVSRLAGNNYGVLSGAITVKRPK